MVYRCRQLTTLPNQHESSPAISNTFPHSGMELERSNGVWAWVLPRRRTSCAHDKGPCLQDNQPPWTNLLYGWLHSPTSLNQLLLNIVRFQSLKQSWAHFQRMMRNTYCVLNNMRWCGLIWIAVTMCGECFPHVWNDSDSFRVLGKQVSELRSGTCSFFRNSYQSIHHGKGLGTSVLQKYFDWHLSGILAVDWQE